MSKINRGYQSPMQQAVAQGFPGARKVNATVTAYSTSKEYKDLVKDRHLPRNRYNPSKQTQLLGSLQPVVDLSNDAKQTFKPFTSKRDVARDAFSIGRGLLSILKGVANIFAALVLFAKNTVSALRSHSFKDQMAKNLKMTGTWLLNGLLSIARGVVQVALSPVYLLRAATTRAIATLKNRGFAPIEQNAEIIALVRELKATAIASVKTPGNPAAQGHAIVKLANELNRVYKKALADGQKAHNLTPKVVEGFLSNVSTKVMKNEKGQYNHDGMQYLSHAAVELADYFMASNHHSQAVVQVKQGHKLKKVTAAQQATAFAQQVAQQMAEQKSSHKKVMEELGQKAVTQGGFALAQGIQNADNFQTLAKARAEVGKQMANLAAKSQAIETNAKVVYKGVHGLVAVTGQDDLRLFNLKRTVVTNDTTGEEVSMVNDTTKAELERGKMEYMQRNKK